MSRLSVLLACAITCAVAFAPGSAWAQGMDRSKGGPVEVTSDNGMEWHQNDQTIIAKGNAKAVRGDVTVTADELIAHYRKKTPAPGAAPAPPPPPAAPGAGGVTDTGDNEIYRLEAIGNVHIFTATDQAFADHAIYDMDQAVLILTGHNLHIITPNQVMTARDVMEYWSQKHMSVGRGDATITTNDGRRLAADIIVGYTVDPNAPPAPGVQKVVAQPAQPAAPAKPAKPGSDPLEASGKLQRVDAFGHVEVRTATEIIHGDKGVYVPDTGIARLAGNVHLTRGQNQLNGDLGVVNLRTGVSVVTRDPGRRVEGLVVPNDATKEPGATGSATPPKTGTTNAAPAAKPQKDGAK
jgi:lipopolysaccharide export system protein LptA